jgi:SPP1 gp7 family putative phage head morphogenesis protein
MVRKKKQKIAAPVKSLKGQELLYRRELNKLGKLLAKAVNEEVLMYLKAQESTYVMDGIGSQLELIFNRLNARFSGTVSAGFAKTTASKMVMMVTRTNKKRFDKTIERATGVDLGGILAAEGLEDFVELSVNGNVSLIKSLSEEHLKNVETIVTNGVKSGAKYSTIAKEILGIKGVNSKLAGRIKTIAMNEVQTINSQITLRRSENLGITKGIYRTSKDERVRKSHKELDGVEYVLKKGAYSSIAQKWIQPGITDINCRCSYSPVINLDNL